MADAHEAVVRRLYGMPGDPSAMAYKLTPRAAVAHRSLGERAAVEVHDPPLRRLLHLLEDEPAARQRRWLCDPVVIQALHELAVRHPSLWRWHEAVASPSLLDVAWQHVAHRPEAIGHLLLPLELRTDRSWTGRVAMASDPFGCVRFPRSDWFLVLHADSDWGGPVLAETVVEVTVGRDRVHWRVAEHERPCLVMDRRSLMALVLDNADSVDAAGLVAHGDRAYPRWHRAEAIVPDGPRYEATHFHAFRSHAPVSGGITRAIVQAIGAGSPHVYAEFCHYVRAIRGFEVKPWTHGVLHSFSDPTWPGIMHLQVPFDEEDQPRLHPLCFVWFGHELGHTKSYLVDTIAYHRGWRFVRNRGASTEVIGRYGRSLSVRTLFQVPYVHLYEWVLLMDLMERGFRDLPWLVETDPREVGEEIRAEIEQSFGLIERHADLTLLGRAAVARFEWLYEELLRRWQRCAGRAIGPESPPPPRATGPACMD